MTSTQPAVRRFSFSYAASWSSCWWLLPIVLFTVIVRPYVYRYVVGEGDLTLVTIGLLFGSKVGFEAASNLHDGLSFSYGYYWFIYNVLPDAWFRTASDIMLFINESGFFFSLATLACGALLVQRLYGPLVAGITITIFGFSPMFLELATSGHQILPAAALLFLGGYLLLLSEDMHRMWACVAATLAAGAIIFASLSVRADTVLALPWLVFVTREWKTDRPALMKYLIRGVTVTAAFFVFLYLQRFFVQGTGSTNVLENFVATFYRLRQIPKGVAAMLITAGLVTALCAGAALVVKWRSLKHPALLTLVLIVPTLVFWLPNPLPSRHFFFAVFGASLFIGVALQAAPIQKRLLILAAFVIVVLNQVVAELMFPVIVARYEWNYPLVGERRSTFHVPLGAFHRNHSANQHLFAILRAEGKTVASLDYPRVIVFGDQISYILMALIDSPQHVEVIENPSPRIAYEVRRGTQTFTLIEKYHYWPADVAAEYARENDIGDAVIYVQPYTTSKYDRASLPNMVKIKADY